MINIGAKTDHTEQYTCTVWDSVMSPLQCFESILVPIMIYTSYR